jgi:hypothetical protein
MRPGALPQQIRQSLTLILLAGGFAYCWQAAGLKSIDRYQIAAVILALIVAVIPPFNAAVTRITQRVNSALAPRRGQVALAIAFLVAIYLLLLAARNSDSLFLKINDEHAYMIQARMLATGRLWMPAYPPAIVPFFDALALINDRVYAPMYFPGTALATVPFIWMHLPFWIMPLLAASASAGMLYSIVSEMFDPVRGLVAVFLLVSLEIFANASTLLLSEMPFLVAELLLFLAWFSFRQRPKWVPALLIGVAGGFAAITRPLDAVCFCVPIGLAIIFQHRRKPAMLLRSASIIVIGASPFMALLLAQNISVTGYWNEFAEALYNHENFPASPMGFHRVDPQYIPAQMSLPKQQWLHDWVLPSFQTHTPLNALRSWPRGRLPQLLNASVANSLVRILLPLALLSLLDMRRIVMTAALAIFVVGYAVYLFFLDHYIVTVLPSMICLILMGWDSLIRAWPERGRLATFLLVSISCMSMTALWRLTAHWQSDSSSAPDQRPANRLLATLPITPAVVLFRFDPRVESFHDDPVYNDGVAFPDDAPVIRARDLGPEKNRDIIHYYAQHQPDRVFYIYDPDARAAGRNPLSPPLGTAADLDVTGTIP